MGTLGRTKGTIMGGKGNPAREERPSVQCPSGGEGVRGLAIGVPSLPGNRRGWGHLGHWVHTPTIASATPTTTPRTHPPTPTTCLPVCLVVCPVTVPVHLGKGNHCPGLACLPIWVCSCSICLGGGPRWGGLSGVRAMGKAGLSGLAGRHHLFPAHATHP